MERQILTLRIVAALVIGSCLLAPTLWQPALDASWAWLLRRPLFNASYFETLWTVSLYILFESYYVSLATTSKPRPPMPKRVDQRAGRAHLWKNGTVRVRKLRGRLSELVVYIAPLLLLDLILIKKFKGVAWQDIVSSGGYEPHSLLNATYSSPANIKSTNFLAPSIHNFSFSSPLQLTRALPPRPITSRRLVVELLSSLVLYDALFFVVHLSLHKIPFLYSKLHATHHDHAEIHAQITNRLDLGERLLLVLTANFSLQIIGAHVMTRTAFVPAFVLFLVQNHCGLDVLSYDKILPRGWGAGPSVHAQHHRLGTTGYAPYLRWCDDLYERLTSSQSNVEAQRRKDSEKMARLLDKTGVNSD